jgi:hypothetical protein
VIAGTGFNRWPAPPFRAPVLRVWRGVAAKVQGLDHRRLAEHRSKLTEIGSIGGYTSYIEREILNYEGQLAAIDQILRAKR